MRLRSMNETCSGYGNPSIARLRLTLVLAIVLACSAWILSPPVDAALVEPDRVDLSLTVEPGDRREYYDGDYISFTLSLEREGYVYFFYLDTQGNLLQLLPNAEMSNHWFPRGEGMPFPSLEVPMDYVIVPPFGEELLLVFVSDNPRIELPGQWSETGVLELEIDLERVEDLIYDASSAVFGRAELSFESRSLPE